MTPKRRPAGGRVDFFPKDQEAALRRMWAGLEAPVRRRIWRAVSRGERVEERRHAPYAVWLARRLRRGLPLQATTGVIAGVLAAMILDGRGAPLPAVVLAAALGLAQPVVAWRRYRRAQEAERANLRIGGGTAPNPPAD